MENTEEIYTDFARVYDELMDNTPYEMWCNRLDQLIASYGVSRPTRDAEGILDSERNLVVDLGCGTGTLTELLYQKGYDCIGVDNSEEMLGIAMEKKVESGSEILYLHQDMRELDLYSTVGTVISVCDSVNYILEEEELLQVFRLVNNYLYPGGIFIFDFNTDYKYREVIGNTTIAENREDCSFIWENYYDPEEEINEYDLTIFVQEEGDTFHRFTETHLQRGYTVGQMRTLVEQSGLKILEITVETARVSHNTSPVVTAALGRLLSAGAMMGSMLKGDDELITLQIKGDGPIGGLTVTADMNGHVKGYANVPDVILPANAQGKLDVGGAVGAGVLSVIRDMGLKDPYVGQIELQTGEIAEDLTYYFAVSEQVPSVVGLGVLMNRDNTVRQAGGFIVQLMPFAEEEMISKLEENIKNLSSVTTMLDAGKTPEGMLEVLLSGMDLEITDTLPVEFACNCSKDRVRKALISIGREELQSMIDDGETIEVNCHFCNKNYNFTVDELKQMIQ